jgi:uncharacterized protein (DUF488 family)
MAEGKLIYTIGHSNRSLEELVGLLRERGVQAVADVRSRPFSRWPQFRRPLLEQALPECLIGYFWLGRELGGHREGVSYEEYMGTEEFSRGLAALEELAGRLATAILCAEARPDQCHRQHITRALEERGWQVLHIIAPGEVWEQTTGPQGRLGL